MVRAVLARVAANVESARPHASCARTSEYNKVTMALSPGDFKDIAQGVQAAVSAIAILLGGAWAYWKFSVQREREPRAEFDLTAEFIGVQDGKWLLEVSARLANKGKVRHPMKDATLNIRYVLSADEVTESADPRHFRQLAFPHDIGRRKVWKDSFIDPGLEFRNSYVTWVPEDATYVLLLCHFRYNNEQWPAQRLLRVPRLSEPTNRNQIGQDTEKSAGA